MYFFRLRGKCFSILIDYFPILTLFIISWRFGFPSVFISLQPEECPLAFLLVRVWTLWTLNILLPENLFIWPWFLKDIFAGDKILHWLLKKIFQYFKNNYFWWEGNSHLSFFPLCSVYCFSLSTVKKFIFGFHQIDCDVCGYRSLCINTAWCYTVYLWLLLNL